MNNTVETQDVFPVRSRVSWGAILAGAVVALAVYFLVGALGVVGGLSISDNVGERTLSNAAVAWAVVTAVLALLLGGWVASQCTVGENKMEAAVYGVLVWGVVFFVLVWLMASGVRMGFNTVMGLASTPAPVAQVSNADLLAAGFTGQEIEANRAKFDNLLRGRDLRSEAQAVANDPRTTAAAWWTFGGILLSMAAAIGGALLGSGPNLVMTAFRMRTVTATTEGYPATRTG